MRKIGFLLLASTILLTGCANNQSSDSSRHSSQATSSQVASRQADPQKDVQLTLKAALKKFHQKFGSAVAITEVSLEAENQRYQYEISGVDDSREYELTVDAKSGKASQAKQEHLDADEANGVERRQAAIATDNLKPLAVISKAATGKIGGGQAISWSLDREAGAPEWEVKVRDGQNYHEVRVAARTGKALSATADDAD